MAFENVFVFLQTRQRLLNVQVLNVLAHLLFVGKSRGLWVDLRTMGENVFLRLGDFAAAYLLPDYLLLFPRVYVSEESIKTAVLLLGGMRINLRRE